MAGDRGDRIALTTSLNVPYVHSGNAIVPTSAARLRAMPQACPVGPIVRTVKVRNQLLVENRYDGTRVPDAK